MKSAVIVCIGLCLFYARASAGPQPSMLGTLTTAERANARVTVLPLAEDPGEMMNACRRIGSLWNDGQYDAALDQYRTLCVRYGEDQFSTSIDWKTPVPTIAPKWGTDVRIGNWDSIYEIHHDVHRASGNMIAVAHLLFGTGNVYTVNLSTDGGLHWSETALQNYGGSINHGVGCAFVGDYLFYTFGVGNRSCMKKYSAATGVVDTFSSGLNFQYVYTLATSDTVREVALCSNQDATNDWLLHTSITKNGQLLYYFSDTSGYTWTQIATNVTDAAGGLDMCYNEGFADRHSWVSYFDTEDSVKIGAININTGGWQNVTKIYSGGIVQPSTSIGAYHDTILCAFNYYSTSAVYCHYMRSFSGGGSWAQGNIGEESDSTVMADVTLRDGGGIGAAYRHYGGTSDHLRYSWRDYSGSWTTPVRLSDSSAYPCKPSIEYLGSGVYGIVYTSNGPKYGAAYFDRSDWVAGVAGAPLPSPRPDLIRIFPSPARDRATVSWELAKPGRVSVSVYNVTGCRVLRAAPALFPAGRHDLALDTKAYASGVYFVRIEGAGPGFTKKLVVIK